MIYFKFQTYVKLTLLEIEVMLSVVVATEVEMLVSVVVVIVVVVVVLTTVVGACVTLCHVIETS